MAKQTKIGERRYRIRFESPTASRAAAGGEVWDWERFAEVWAKITFPNTRSGEELEANHSVSSTAAVFDIMYRDDITEKMRVVFDGDNYDILFIQRPDFRQSLLIQAQKVV